MLFGQVKDNFQKNEKRYQDSLVIQIASYETKLPKIGQNWEKIRIITSKVPKKANTMFIQFNIVHEIDIWELGCVMPCNIHRKVLNTVPSRIVSRLEYSPHQKLDILIESSLK